MQSKLAEALRLKYQPVAVLLTNERPAEATQLKEGARGCAAALIQAAAKGRVGVFDRRTFGCPGGGTGLGFGDCYVGFPIRRLLSTGGSAVLRSGATYDMGEGERFHASPEVTERWVRALPYREVPTEYIVVEPLERVADGEQVSLVLMLVNPDQLSALVTLAGFRTGDVNPVVSPWGAACQSILFAYAESERSPPRGVIGFFDISQRHKVDRDLLSFTMPYGMFQTMEADVEASFLRGEAWCKLQDRQ
jgi:uncharacterized protein (DUF169 family)